MTDQQRQYQHWPADWAKENLPAMERLMQNGLTFNYAFTNSCMCSPSRATFFTGTYPAQHGVTEVLNLANNSGTVRDLQQVMKSDYQNMARILRTAGYKVVYKGKWHLTKPVLFDVEEDQRRWTNFDIGNIAQNWGFDGWNPPDGGDTVGVNDMGGGISNNDGRFVDGDGTANGIELNGMQAELAVERSILNFIQEYDSDEPFCLIVSLVNPHDVLAYPGTGVSNIGETPLYEQANYQLSDFSDLPIELPPNAHDDLSTKPSVQHAVKETLDATLGVLPTKEEQLNYVRFYAYLHTVVDKQIAKVLDALDAKGLTDDTLIIRTADHGEMGLSHGLRQKTEVVYDEAIRVPLIFSNPRLFPQAQETNALAGLVDVLPTLATICGVPNRDNWTFKGEDLSAILENPNLEVQDAIHFTYDDYDSAYDDVVGRIGVKEPAHIRAIREKNWKYAVYFDPDTGKPMEFELYNLENDPLEMTNLAHDKFSTRVSRREQQRLHQKLTRKMEALGTKPTNVLWPKISGRSITVTR